MSDDRWTLSQELFHELWDLDADGRARRLQHIAADDADMADTVARLLAAAETDEPATDQVAAAIDALMNGPDIPPGIRIGRYRVGRLLGRGGAGAVYHAVHEESEQEVAIKVVNLAWTSPENRTAFTAEQRTLAALNHPGIAHLYDTGALDEGTPWFAMEYVPDASPITDYCREHGLAIADRLRLFRQVCEAVAYAHARLIVHRDLKPSNILVSREGMVKVVDFGIARHLAQTEAPAVAVFQATYLRSLTPTTAAPEQLTGDTVGLYTDLYALGNVLFKLLTDTPPFNVEGHPLGEIRKMVLEQACPRPSSRGIADRRVSRRGWRELDCVCLRLLEKDPSRRYESATALRSDIDSYLTGQPLSAHPQTWTYRGTKFVTRHAPLVAAVGIAAVLLVALTAIYVRRVTREQQATAQQAARTERLQDFIVGLFSGQDTDTGPAHDLTVRTLLERGAATADSLGGEPEIQAEMRHTLGTIFGELGDFDRANAMLTQSVEDKKRLLPPGDRRLIEGILALGFLRADQSQYADADKFATDAIASAQLPSTDPLAVRTTLLRAKVLVGRGDYSHAIALLDPIVSRARVADASVEVALAVTELANAHQYSGHLAEADRLNRQVLEFDRRVFGDAHPNVAHDLLNLAAAAVTRAEYADAERMERQALTIFTTWYGPDHPETGSATMILAQALVAQDRFDEAAALLDRARIVFLRSYPEPHRRVGLIYNEIANLAMRRGNYAEAVDGFTRALAMYRRVFPDGRSQYISVGLANLGNAYTELGQYAKAEMLLREAVTLSTSILTAAHPNTATAQLRLARLLLKQHRNAESLPFLEQGCAVLTKIQSSSSLQKRCQDDLAAARK